MAKVAALAYLDKIQFWLPNRCPSIPLLRRECGKGGLHVHNSPAPFDKRFKQRIQLRQPTKTALAHISKFEGLHLNYAEVSLDLIFDDSRARDHADHFVHRHHVKRYHGDQGVRIVGGTRYTGPRSAPNLLANYADKPCRATEEKYCLHLDWRINGVNAGEKVHRCAGVKMHQG